MADAQLSDFDIDIDSSGVRDLIEMAIVRQSPPGENGAFLSNQGQQARVFSFRAWFIGVDVGSGEAFADSLEELEDVEFVHPDLGSFIGMIERAESVRDEVRGAVAFDIVFVENLLGAVLPNSILNIAESANASWLDNIQDNISAAGRAINDSLSGLSAIGGLGRSFVAVLDSGIDVFEGTLSTITNPANSLIGITSFGTSLPGRLVGSVSRMAERNLQLIADLQDAPSKFSKNFRDSMAQLQLTVDKQLGKISKGQTSLERKKNEARQQISDVLKINSSSVLGAKMAAIYSDDQSETNQIRDLQTVKTFDDNGNFVGESPDRPIISSDEIERSVKETKEMLQEAVELDRSLRLPRELAGLLQRYFNEIKLELPKEKIVRVNVETSLCNILNAHGLSYQLLDEIRRLNPQIKNAAKVTGDVRIFTNV